MKSRPILFLLGVITTATVAALAGLIVVITGSCSVAATEPHSEPVYWALETTLENSVNRRSRDIVLPANLSQLDLAAGAESCKAMCQQCHGGPGAEPAVWARDMYPQPPEMSHVAQEMGSEEIFWILKHGIKMSGMPAIGPSHSDETLWEIVAFVQQISTMSAEQYAASTETADGEGKLADDGHDHVY